MGNSATVDTRCFGIIQTQSNQIICGDCAEILKTLPNEYVDLTITSPPYDDLRTYKGYSFDFQTIIKEILRVTKTGGVLVWIVGDSVKDGSETLNSFRQALLIKDCGFNIHDTMIYQKLGSSLSDDTRYFQSFEYMFIFSKGKPKTFNPICDRKNNHAGALKKPHIREQNGEIGYRKAVKVNRFGKRWNVWQYSPGFLKSTLDKIAYEHPAIMPEDLATDHIKSWSNEGDLVLDPFAGSGTVLKMARLLNRNYLGIEISKEYCELIEKRLSMHNNERLDNFPLQISESVEEKI